MKSLASTRRRVSPALRVYTRFALELMVVGGYRQGHLIEPPTAPAYPSAHLEQDATAFQGLRYGRSLGHFGLARRRQASLLQGTNDLLSAHVASSVDGSAAHPASKDWAARTGQQGRTHRNPAPHTIDRGRWHQRQHCA